jgi:hypothetical protein
VIFDDRGREDKEILVISMDIGSCFVVAGLDGFVFGVQRVDFEDLVRGGLVDMSLIHLFLGFVDFDQILSDCLLDQLILEGIEKGILLIF